MRVLVFALSLLLPLASVAKIKEYPISALEPTRDQRMAVRAMNDHLENLHYRKVALDDAMSERIFKRYLKRLDPNRMFLTQADLKVLDRYRLKLDDAIHHAKLAAAYDIFVYVRKRIEAQVERAVAMVRAGKFDFSRREYYEFDREDAEWAADQAALDELWRLRIKNDMIALQLTDEEKHGDAETHESVPDKLVKRYQGAARRIRQLGPNDVFESFVNSYTLNIEPHTSYMSPRNAENFDIGMRLSLEGIGAVLRGKLEHTVVQRLVPGGAAYQAGQLKAGDRIVGVGQGKDGPIEDVVGWRLQDVVDLIRGKKGTTVRLRVLPKRSGEGGPTRVIAIVRDKIKLENQAASAKVIEGLSGMPKGMKIGVIELPAFYRDFRAQAAGERNFRSTTRDVRKLIAELQDQGISGLVIDLRGNGGGSLTEATNLTGLFIPKGPVVQIKSSQGSVEVERDPDPEQVYKGPLAVLVDRNSASASEIFASAIQDYQRGIILGEPTYGKGTVQTLIDLARTRRLRHGHDLGRLRLTMAQFFRINGGSTQHKGVVPDIVFPTAVSAEDHGERALENALPWSRIDPLAYSLQGFGGSIALLREHHEARIKTDPGFKYLLAEEAEVQRLRDQKRVVLLAAERRQEWHDREMRRLKRRNEFRASRGLKALTKQEFDDRRDADDPEDEDTKAIERIHLDEAVRVLADYVQASGPLTAQRRSSVN